MSDNGKSFEFGYDNTSDTYGYYKDGVFTQFGGGGLSTKCIVKEQIVVGYFVPQGIPNMLLYFGNDGSYYTHSNGATFFDHVNTLSDCFNISYSLDGGSNKTITFTFKKDGVYFWLGQLYGVNPDNAFPTLYQAGFSHTQYIWNSGNYARPLTLGYCGVELPS